MKTTQKIKKTPWRQCNIHYYAAGENRIKHFAGHPARTRDNVARFVAWCHETGRVVTLVGWCG